MRVDSSSLSSPHERQNNGLRSKSERRIENRPVGVNSAELTPTASAPSDDVDQGPASRMGRPTLGGAQEARARFRVGSHTEFVQSKIHRAFDATRSDSPTTGVRRSEGLQTDPGGLRGGPQRARGPPILRQVSADPRAFRLRRTSRRPSTRARPPILRQVSADPRAFRLRRTSRRPSTRARPPIPRPLLPTFMPPSRRRHRPVADVHVPASDGTSRRGQCERLAAPTSRDL